MFVSDEGPVLETLDFTIHIGSTPTFLYFLGLIHCQNQILSIALPTQSGLADGIFQTALWKRLPAFTHALR